MKRNRFVRLVGYQKPSRKVDMPKVDVLRWTCKTPLLILIKNLYVSDMWFGVAPRNNIKGHVFKRDWIAYSKYDNHSKFYKIYITKGVRGGGTYEHEYKNPHFDNEQDAHMFSPYQEKATIMDLILIW